MAPRPAHGPQHGRDDVNPLYIVVFLAVSIVVGYLVRLLVRRGRR